MSKQTVDLSKHSLANAKRITNRLKKEQPGVKFHFILPVANGGSKKNKKSVVKCPICNSDLERTEEGVKCTSANVPAILSDIAEAKQRYRESAGLWLSKVAYRFLAHYERDGVKAVCDFFEKVY